MSQHSIQAQTKNDTVPTELDLREHLAHLTTPRAKRGGSCLRQHGARVRAHRAASAPTPDDGQTRVPARPARLSSTPPRVNIGALRTLPLCFTGIRVVYSGPHGRPVYYIQVLKPHANETCYNIIYIVF
ncbi:hypothetical protein EVAR_35901_1 [Eumeta japonica]|uniref:Uncharacterized protein n=1 Tax=Eumeta variegata TaxID=151549 RepID=A0A4C1WWU3_EUMVA|nr:hypothetical protein EVAR_35901_1 [Eumeta japonica]